MNGRQHMGGKRGEWWDDGKPSGPGPSICDTGPFTLGGPRCPGCKRALVMGMGKRISFAFSVDQNRLNIANNRHRKEKKSSQ